MDQLTILLFKNLQEAIIRIPEIRKSGTFEFSEFDVIIENCIMLYGFQCVIQSDELQKLKSDSSDFYFEVISKINQQSKNDIFSQFDQNTYTTLKHFDQRLLAYRKVVEVFFIKFIHSAEQTATISEKYKQHLKFQLNLSRLLDYQILGFSKTPEIIYIHDGKKIKIPENPIPTQITLIKKKIAEFDTTIKYLTSHQKQTIIEDYKFWWESYKTFIENNFPALCNDLDWYRGG